MSHPLVWARYETQQQAEEAQHTLRYGTARWAVEHRPSPRWPDYPWCLVDLGWEERSDVPRAENPW